MPSPSPVLAQPAFAPSAPPITRAPGRDAQEFALTETCRVGEAPGLALRRLADRLRERRAEIVGLMLFGPMAARPAVEQALREALGAPEWPMLWVEGAGCEGQALVGAQAFALAGGAINRVVLNGRVVASRYRLGEAELCWVGACLPDDVHAEPGVQTALAFTRLERALDAAGFALGDLVRTWCYNHRLLEWYGEFNRVRSARYRETRFRVGATPASTGISAANPAGAALVLAGLALRPAVDDGRTLARAVGSPLQCPAPAYGSAFSRAVELELGATRRVLISGTASIEPGGATVFQGDAARQIELTLRVVGAILESRGLGWADVTRALAYFKDPVFARDFARHCQNHRWSGGPRLDLHCDICRHDLLFELELDAETTRPAP